MENVQFTIDNGLCIACGICEGICPNGCIKIVKDKSSYFPHIGSNCINCGLCFYVCPGKGREGSSQQMEIRLSDLVGRSLQVYNAWSKNESIRHFSASGGVVTTLIYGLLKNKIYDAAFVVDSFSYDNYVQTTLVDKCERIIDCSDERYLTTKSRYVPIGHQNAIKYMIDHPKSRIIIVATPCAIRGFLNTIKSRKMNRDNYLFFGLFL